MVLCEGDSDIIYLKHISKTLFPDWDFEKKNIGLIQIGGKGNFYRYHEFFKCFDVPVQIISDLDSLIDQFEGLGASEESKKLREALMNDINKVLEKQENFNITAEQAKGIIEQNTFKKRYDRTKEISEKIGAGDKVTQDELEEFKNLFIKEKIYHQRKILKESSEIKEKKHQLINALREEGIHIFLKGSVEDYYPVGIEGGDKPTRALSACKIISRQEDIGQLCEEVKYKG